jgi:hypothetical protein
MDVDEMGPGVYALVINTPHGEVVYVGSTVKTFGERYKSHLYDLNKGTHRNHYLQNLWNKYKNIELRPLTECPPGDVRLCEQFWIEHFPGGTINLASSYPGVPLIGRRKPEVGLKISQALKGKPSPLKGRPLTEEHCKKISQALKGKPSPLRGKPKSLEHREKAMQARWHKNSSQEEKTNAS